MEVKKTKQNTYYRGQNIYKLKKKKVIKLNYLQIIIVALNSYMAMILLIQLSD